MSETDGSLWDDLASALNGLENALRATADDMVKSNAEFATSSGLTAKIVRSTSGECCAWCSSIAGTYTYGSEPKDVYRRHNNCDCTVEYVTSKGSQNVHSKQWTRASEADKIEERKTVGLNAEKIISGGRITDPNSKYANKWAVSYYEEIRHKSTDCAKIAKRLGAKEQDIQKIKNYLFVDNSLWDESSQSWRRFHEDAAIAQSWQRLAEGEEILPHDRTLINHELLEMEIKKNNPGISHDDAHSLACRTFNYQEEAEEYYVGLRERKKRK